MNLHCNDTENGEKWKKKLRCEHVVENPIDVKTITEFAFNDDVFMLWLNIFFFVCYYITRLFFSNAIFYIFFSLSLFL